MPTAIAVPHPGLALPSPDAHTPDAQVLNPPERQSLDAALADVHRLVEQHGHLIVVYPRSTPEAQVRRLYTARSILESDRIALLETPLPPLATAVLVRQLRQLSLYEFSPGVLGCAARLLTYYIYAGALLNSVAKLDRIPVSLRTHASSWLPGTQFAVLANPAPQLIRIGGESRLAGPEFGTQIAVARGQLTSDWVEGTLSSQWSVRGLQELELPADSPRWWGTGKLVEFAAVIPELGTLYRLVSSVQVQLCQWCGLELLGDRCAFCRAPLPRSQQGRQRPRQRHELPGQQRQLPAGPSAAQVGTAGGPPGGGRDAERGGVHGGAPVSGRAWD